MTLGGLAIAVGLLVDAAIIVTENAVHRLRVDRDQPRRETVLRAASEVAPPIAFATLIVIAVFLPLLAMTGLEGRLYRPLAAAVIATLTASLLLALTLVPVVGSLVLRPPPPGRPEDVFLLRRIKAWYAPLLERALRHGVAVRV